MEPFLSAMGHPDSGTLGTIVAIYNLVRLRTALVRESPHSVRL